MGAKREYYSRSSEGTFYMSSLPNAANMFGIVSHVQMYTSAGRQERRVGVGVEREYEKKKKVKLTQ